MQMAGTGLLETGNTENSIFRPFAPAFVLLTHNCYIL